MPRLIMKSHRSRLQVGAPLSLRYTSAETNFMLADTLGNLLRGTSSLFNPNGLLGGIAMLGASRFSETLPVARTVSNLFHSNTAVDWSDSLEHRRGLETLLRIPDHEMCRIRCSTSQGLHSQLR